MSKIFFKGRIQSYIVCYGCHQSVSVLWLPHNLRKAPLQFASVTRLLYPAFLVTELCKYTHRKINYGKIQNKQIAICNQKTKLNENEFFLRKKISSKMKSKNIHKKIRGGGNFPGQHFSGGEVLFLERISRTYAPTRCFELFWSASFKWLLHLNSKIAS